jgi:serine/threonine protein kinase
MPLEAGQQLLHYRLTEKLGEGGMGVVWKAVDTDLDREVAIKFLPDSFSQDAERRARFEREAKLLASLNHPGIATIHGLHQWESTSFLAMELVPGEDLAVRLARGPVSLEESLRYAVQIAEALEAAHQNGIVHRDLKPANVLLTPEGKLKVLDFGLAKVQAETDPGADPSQSPTMTAASQAGMIMGTAGYMAPEQAAPFDLEKLELTGEAVPVLRGGNHSIFATNYRRENGVAQFDLSDDGTLVYAAGYPSPKAGFGTCPRNPVSVHVPVTLRTDLLGSKSGCRGSA